MNKSTGIVIVVIIIALGVWLMTKSSSSDMKMQPSTTAQMETSKTTAETTIDFSDAALNQEAAVIDAQIGTLSTETSAAAQPAQ